MSKPTDRAPREVTVLFSKAPFISQLLRALLDGRVKRNGLSVFKNFILFFFFLQISERFGGVEHWYTDSANIIKSCCRCATIIKEETGLLQICGETNLHAFRSPHRLR